MDSVFYIERPTGKVLWKLGGASYTIDNATYVPFVNPTADAFYRQHDARFQPSWSYACGGGQISVFDDETQMPSPARGVVYDVTLPPTMNGGPTTDCATPADAGASGSASATVAWQYAGAGAVTAGGSFRILPDGSRTIGWGADGLSLVLTEVDVDGHDLLDVKNTAIEPSYRAIKVPLDQFDLAVLRNTAGGPVRVTQARVVDGGVEE
jgi:hypothetical protein